MVGIILAGDRRSKLNTVYLRYQRDPAFSHLRKPFDNQPPRQFVPGEGNEFPLVMFVGEAPGGMENAQGRPFVGTAGRQLDEWLAHAEMDRDSVFITNAVKYQPPRNRSPLSTERQASRWYLAAEATILRPPVIALMGNCPLRTVFGDREVIGVRHGTVMERNGRVFYPLYHPMAVIYDPEKQQSALDDMRGLMSVVWGLVIS